VPSRRTQAGQKPSFRILDHTANHINHGGQPDGSAGHRSTAVVRRLQNPAA
jgi:hypothetical protein